MTIDSPDLTFSPGLPLPAAAYTLSLGRPSLLVETNNRAVMVSTLTGRVEVTPINAYGDLAGAARLLAPGSPVSLDADGRWRLSWAGDGDDGATLMFA